MLSRGVWTLLFWHFYSALEVQAEHRMFHPTRASPSCTYWNEAVDFWAITLLIRGRSSSAHSSEMGEGEPEERKLPEPGIIAETPVASCHY
jgi:hypothetical protein